MPRAGMGLMDMLNFAHILQEYFGGGGPICGQLPNVLS